MGEKVTDGVDIETVGDLVLFLTRFPHGTKVWFQDAEMGNVMPLGIEVDDDGDVLFTAT